MRTRWAAAFIALTVVAALGGTTAARAGVDAARCGGDCGGDGAVTVDELVRAVNIALGAAARDTCSAADTDGDGAVGIHELVAAVGFALDGCPTVTPTTAGLVFNGEDNRLHAYLPGPGFPSQVVIPSDRDEPGRGRDINGQICFTRGAGGEVYFIAGEDTDQGTMNEGAGWGLFELRGVFPQLDFVQLGHLQPTYQPGHSPENYGCGFLSDGRLLTSDVGNQASGAGNGQLIIWFPPLDDDARYCKLDVGIATAGQIAVDDQDRVYLTSARSTQSGNAGVYRYGGAFPTGDDPAGGCGRVDPAGGPLVDDGRITKELFIAADPTIATPGGLAIKPDGGFYVASVLNGTIAEYDAGGTFIRRVLSASGPGLPTPSGNPFGIGLASDGTIYFADIGLRLGPGGIGPGPNLGKVRRVRFVDGAPQPPEIMREGLDFPDGIGIFEGTTAATIP